MVNIVSCRTINTTSAKTAQGTIQTLFKVRGGQETVFQLGEVNGIHEIGEGEINIFLTFPRSGCGAPLN